MTTRNPTITSLLKLPDANQFANCNHSVHIKYVLVILSAKYKKHFNLVEPDQRLKAISQINLASQFGISVVAMHNILKRMCEYENLGEPIG